MPAATLSRRRLYSACSIWGGGTWVLGGRGRALPEPLVGGKLAHRLGDLGRAGHEEILLRRVEGHRRDVRRRHANHGSVETVESVLRDDGRNLGAKAAREVVLMDDHRLARLAD